MNSDKHTTVVGDADSEGGCACEGGEQGVCGKAQYLLLNFALNLKLIF